MRVVLNTVVFVVFLKQSFIILRAQKIPSVEGVNALRKSNAIAIIFRFEFQHRTLK